MILKIEYESGEQGVNHRKFVIDAYHMDPTPGTIAPLLVHLADILCRNPEDVWRIIPVHIPELAGATVTRQNDPEDR